MDEWKEDRIQYHVSRYDALQCRDESCFYIATIPASDRRPVLLKPETGMRSGQSLLIHSQRQSEFQCHDRSAIG